MSTDLYTIGYEGVSQATLLQHLLYNEIEFLVYIRQLPQSRKPGLSKNALAAAVEAQGMKYLHMRSLGTPRDLRYQRKIDHDQEAFRLGFLEYLATQDEAMNDLVALAQQKRCCLMCFEANHTICHRLFVAERAVAMSDGEIHVVHLDALSTISGR